MRKQFTANNLYFNYFLGNDINAFDRWAIHKQRLKDILYTAGAAYEFDYMKLAEVELGDVYTIILKKKDIEFSNRQVVSMQHGLTNMTSGEYTAMLNKVNGD